MAAVTEKAVKDKIAKVVEIYSKYNDLYTLTPMTFGYGESGHPDRLLLINGTLVGIEAKKDQNNHHTRPELKPKSNEVMQKRQREKIERAGGLWICVHYYNIHELLVMLDSVAGIKSDKFSFAHIENLKKLTGGVEWL